MERGREGVEPAGPVGDVAGDWMPLTEIWGNVTDCLRKGYGGAIASRTRDRSEAQPGEARSAGWRGAMKGKKRMEPDRGLTESVK